MSSLRVVLDTNCLVSALVFTHGRLTGLRKCWQAGLFVPVMCKETIAELTRVLAYPKFHLKAADVNALLADILPYAERFILPETLKTIDGLADVTDAVFLHLARQAKTEWLVSGDAHLLCLKNHPLDVKVISAADFLRVLDMPEVRNSAEDS